MGIRRPIELSLVVVIIAAGGCASGPSPSLPSTPKTLVPLASASPIQPLNPSRPVPGPIAQTGFQYGQVEMVSPAILTQDDSGNSVPPGARPQSNSSGSDRGQAMEIDLASALAITDAQNPQVALAREKIGEAQAQFDRARLMWLPSIRGGVNYNKHEGQIQDVAGRIITTSRNSLYTGLGAAAIGAGSPAVPGAIAQFHLTDAIHQPRIAQSVVCARSFAAEAQTNDTLLQTALAYLELLRAEQELAIARETVEHARQLCELTAAYAKAGQGLQSDDDRAQAELALRENDVLRAEEGVAVASAQLAQLLQLDPSQPLVPQEHVVAPIELVSADVPVQELVARGLGERPEISESRYLIDEAVQRLRREQCAPLVPSVLLGASYGGLGGGLGGEFRNFGNRFDGDAVAYWELRNLGLGDAAARREASSRVEQARLREISALDRVAREVVESHAQVQSRRRRIATAQRGIEVAQASYERNLQRIREMQGLPLEALQSIQALAQSRRDYLRAVSDYNVAQFQLLRNVGGHWPPGER